MQEFVLRASDELNQIAVECVSVSLEETSRVVRNSASKVPDREAGN